MKAFRFPLERALDWRRMQLDVEQSKIQAIAARIQQLDTQRRGLSAERSLAEREVLHAKTIEGRDLARIAAFQLHVRNAELTITETRGRYEHELTAQREKLVEAQRQVKLLQNLRDKRMTRWSADLAREQEQFAGEAFLARWQTGHGSPSKQQRNLE